jgi:hypothetical protein
MSQQSAGIKTTYMQQNRYFLGLTFTVREKNGRARYDIG